MSLKKYLQQFSKEQLIAQIMELSAKYKDVKKYYEFSINPDSNKAKEEAKKIIGKCISTETNYGLKLREARKAITNFKKLSPAENDIAEVMLFYVERGIEFTNCFGDINEPFYNSIAGMFYDLCKYVKKNGLQAQFTPECKEIVAQTVNIGWGFHDDLSSCYRELLENP